MFLRIVFFTIVYGSIGILFFRLVGEGGVQAYFLLAQEASEAKHILENIYRKETAISKEIRLLRSNKEYIREQVKIRLYHLYPNEILYTFHEEDNVQ